MGKTAFVFPGQGAQYAGMAKEFYDNFEASRRIFAAASVAAGYSLEELCFKENDRLNRTRYTQPALLTASCAILAAMEERCGGLRTDRAAVEEHCGGLGTDRAAVEERCGGLGADMTAGLSLGEYSALVAAGALEFAEAVRLVCRRGIYMEEAVPEGQGAMLAVISRRPLPVEEICRGVGGTVSVANYNYPGQRVITGERAAVVAAGERLLQAGASRVVPLKVSGPFHSAMLAGAGRLLEADLAAAVIHPPRIPFISNVTASEVREVRRIRRLLARQVCSPVYWQQSMEYMIAQGADTIVEIGPGQTLGHFAKKIDRKLRVISIERPEDLERLPKSVARAAGNCA